MTAAKNHTNILIGFYGGERGETWYPRSIRLARAREGDENLEGTVVPPMWNSDVFSPTIIQHQQFMSWRFPQRHNTNAYPLWNSDGFSPTIFQHQQSIPFGGTKVSFEIKTCKNIPGREHIQSGIIILHGKNQWDNFSGKPNIH